MLRRGVPSGPIVIFTYDPGVIETPWLFEYFPVFRDQIRRSLPSLEAISASFSGSHSIHVSPFPLPRDLAGGSAGAAWRYPERYLDRNFRGGTSAFRQLDPSVCQQALDAAQADLESGAWDSRFGALRSLHEYDHGYTFITITCPLFGKLSRPDVP